MTMGSQLTEYFAAFPARSPRGAETIELPPVVGWRKDPLEHDPLMSQLHRWRSRRIVITPEQTAQSADKAKRPASTLNQLLNADMQLAHDPFMSQLLRRRSRRIVISSEQRAQPPAAKAKRPTPTLNQQIDADMRREFTNLTKQWQSAHQFTSSISDVALHPAYQRIIGLGPAVLPLIFRDLEKSLNHWFWALNALTGENPVPEDQYGDMEAMRARWLEWGRARGIIA